jgi:predicted ATPase
VEEPENQLYPTLLWELAEEFRSYSVRGGQVFVSTHSPDFLNATRIEEVFWLEKEDGYTKIRRASENEQIKIYMDEGDQMGYLWKQGSRDIAPYLKLDGSNTSRSFNNLITGLKKFNRQ